MTVAAFDHSFLIVNHWWEPTKIYQLFLISFAFSIKRLLHVICHDQSVADSHARRCRPRSCPLSHVQFYSIFFQSVFVLCSLAVSQPLNPVSADVFLLYVTLCSFAIAGDRLYKCVRLTFLACISFTEMLHEAFQISANLFVSTQRHVFCDSLPTFVIMRAATSIQGQVTMTPSPHYFIAICCAVFADKSGKVGKDGCFCLQTATDMQDSSLTGLIWLLFCSVTPFPSPLYLAPYSSVYQVPSVSGLRWGCLLLLKHLFYKCNESSTLYWKNSHSQKGILIYLFYLICEALFRHTTLFYILKFWTKRWFQFLC